MVGELTYQAVLSDKVTLQPSLQYVRNPGAAIPISANRFSQEYQKPAFVAGIRATITY